MPWNYQTVMGLMKPYPPRDKLDKLEPGQEDEATPDPDGVPWEVGDSDGETRGCGEGDDMSEHGEGDNLDAPAPDFDEEDWLQPPEGHAASSGGGDAESQEGGDVGGAPW